MLPEPASRTDGSQLWAGGGLAPVRVKPSTRPFLGANSSTANARARRFYALGADGGAVITAIAKGGPADHAGLRRHDVVTAVDGHRVHSMPELSQQIARHRVGDVVILAVMRSGLATPMTLTLGHRPEQSGHDHWDR